MMSRTVRRAAAGGWSACPPGARKLMAQEIPQEIPLTQHTDDPVRFVHYRESAQAGEPHDVFASGLLDTLAPPVGIGSAPLWSSDTPA